MHYKNGKEAHEGDSVLGETFKGSGDILAGKLYNLQPGSETCNAHLASPIMGGTGVTCVTVNELYLAADAFKAPILARIIC